MGTTEAIALLTIYIVVQLFFVNNISLKIAE